MSRYEDDRDNAVLVLLYAVGIGAWVLLVLLVLVTPALVLYAYRAGS